LHYSHINEFSDSKEVTLPGTFDNESVNLATYILNSVTNIFSHDGIFVNDDLTVS